MKTYRGLLPWFLIFGSVFLLAVAMPRSTRAAVTALVDTGASWTFLDDGSDQELYWVDPSYDDSFWDSGASPLGFGEPYIVTQTTPQIITTYFRHTFTVINPQAITNLTGRVLRDDAVRIFLNGFEIYRNNFFGGAIHYQTLSAIGEAGAYLEMIIDPSLLVEGPNVIAAEVHQSSVQSSDLVFDFILATDADVPEQGRISINQPRSGEQLRAGSDIAITTTMTNVTSPILQVEFLAGTSLLGQVNASPYNFTWSNAPLGDFLLRAIATASDGNAYTSAAVAVSIVANVVPQGAITDPRDGAMLPEGPIEIRAAATDDRAVVLAEFFVNGSKIGEDSSIPFSCNWSDASSGNYSLMTRFTDDEGATANSPPISIQVLVGVGLVRGPYLQIGTKQSMIVRWRTDLDYDSVVRYGTAPGQLNHVVSVPGLRTEHEVQLAGLLPRTKYHYSIGHSAATLASGADYFFMTHPPEPQSTRIWVIGDSGTGSAQAKAVYDQYRAFTGNRYTDLWLMLGDNAYGSGTDEQYQFAMFDMYPELLRQTAVWPALGNHDFNAAYYDIFTLPRNGEAGGVPSGTEHYFSFDYGNIHFVNLDGYFSGSRLSNGPMWNWLAQDLAAHTNEWLIAFWHQPPYTKGSHDSDRELDLIQMRENFVPMLESYGVDLVLCGHSHCYERSYLLRGHYGLSSTLTPQMILDSGSGRTDEGGPYVKVADHGTVYVVAGSSGWATFGSMDHPVMHTSLLRMGSLILDIDGGTLQAKFLRETGEIDDYFTIQKGALGPRITGINFEEGTVSLYWTSVPGVKYQMQYATDLTLKNWQSVGPQITASGSESGTGHVPPADANAGFYRIVVVQ